MQIQVANPTAFWPVIVLVATATITDLRSRRIPNAVVFPYLFLGLIVSAIVHGWSGIWQSVLGVLLAAVIQGVPCYFGWMGMGDLKLCMAIGAWIGPWQFLLAFIMTSLFGCAVALVWAAARGVLGEVLSSTASFILGERKGITLEHPAARRMPYAPAIALGTICSFLGRQL